MRPPRSPYDDYTTRCPMLGHLVDFSYCRAPGTDLPCRRIMDCWHERIDIAAYLNENLTAEEIQAVTAPAKPKMAQLLELVEKAKGKM